MPPASLSPIPKNLATAVPFAEPSERAPDARTAYGIATAAERARRPHQELLGHRLYWMSSARIGACDVPAGTGHFVVVGRHTHCDVVLDRDERISLRHLLVRSTLLDDGCPVLSISDLSTSLGFALADGSVQRNIRATGPVVVKVGAYTLVALPSGELPAELPPPKVESLVDSLDGEAHPYRGSVRSRPDNAVTLMPRLLDLALDPLPPSSNSVQSWELVARSAHGQATAAIPRSALERGVLLGRSPKCTLGGLQTIFSIGTSRVHALLLAKHERLFAFDMASSNGTFDVAGRRVRFLELARNGTELVFGPGRDVVMYVRAS